MIKMAAEIMMKRTWSLINCLIMIITVLFFNSFYFVNRFKFEFSSDPIL